MVAEERSEQPDADWLAGATIEFGGEITERIEVPIEGVEFGDDDAYVA